MSVATNLQAAINQFANDPNIGFTPLQCDGVIGAATFAAAMYALTSVNLGTTSQGDIVQGTRSNAPASWAAGNFINALSTSSTAIADLTASASDITDTLNAGASTFGFSPTPCPVAAATAAPPSALQQALAPQPVPTPNNSANVPPAVQQAIASNTSFLGLGLPSWAVYGGGAAVVLGIIYLIVKRRRANP